MQELQLGSIGISVLLTILLRMVYGTWEVGNRAKPWIAVGCGLVLAVAAMLTTLPADKCSISVVASYLVQGFMTGATATGLYEMTKSAK